MDIITNLTAQEAAAIALKNRLYVSGWGLSSQLSLISKGKMPDAKVVLCEKDGKCVGVAVRISKGKYWNTAVFVRKSERRQGIGSKLLSNVKTDDSIAGYGIEGCQNFWDKNNVSWHY